MRVISGIAKGRRLKSFKGQAVRPTADRVKESLFNILPRDLSGYRVLDLFAGTGNLTLEALSRGAGEACLIEQSQRAAKLIRENLLALELSQHAHVRIMPVPRAISSLAARAKEFDLIFVDPPYEKGWVDRVLGAIALGALLAEKGILVLEHNTRENTQKRYGRLGVRDQRCYGDTLLTFFENVGLGHQVKENESTWHVRT